MSNNIAERLKFRASDVEKRLSELLFSDSQKEPALSQLGAAIRHGALNGGKRLRPFLVIEACLLCGGTEEEAMPAACAIEMVHSYSLVHDDLPAMDDADTRRGLPSVHKAFDEAIGILAGDGLLTDAFAVVTEPETYPPQVAAKLVHALAVGAGSAGMVGGQMMDLYPADQSPAQIVGIQQRKTGALIEAAAVMGGVVAQADAKTLSQLSQYAKKIGEAFQIVDDILDETSTEEVLGKPTGADAEAGKATFVAVLGLDGARARVADLTREAKEALSSFGEKAEPLSDLADMLAARAT